MLRNAYFLAKIVADTAENDRNFVKNLPKIGNCPTGPRGSRHFLKPQEDAAAALLRPQAVMRQEELAALRARHTAAPMGGVPIWKLNRKLNRKLNEIQNIWYLWHNHDKIKLKSINSTFSFQLFQVVAAFFKKILEKPSKFHENQRKSRRDLKNRTFQHV